MQNKSQLSGLSLLRKAMSLTFCAGLSVSLLSGGCDKGNDKDKESDEDKKETESEGKDTDGEGDSDGKKDTDGDSDDDKKDDDKKDDDSTGDIPANKQELTEDQAARISKLCKETCEDKEVLECEAKVLSKDPDECVKGCTSELGGFFGASEDETCLDSLEDTFTCLYGTKCDEFSKTYTQLLGLLQKEGSFTGECADKFEKSSEHCGEDLKKNVGDLPIGDLPIDDFPKPDSTVMDIVVDGSKWTTVEATVTKVGDDSYKVVLSDKDGLGCDEGTETLENAISTTITGTKTDKALVYFQHNKMSTKVEGASVNLGSAEGDKDQTRDVQIQAQHSSEEYSVTGTITAKVCPDAE